MLFSLLTNIAASGLQIWSEGSLCNWNRVSPGCQILKKNSQKEIGETGTRKLSMNLQYSDFARSKTACA